MANLRLRFLARAAQDAARLREPGAEIDVIVHRLAGAAGVFGFDNVSRLASIVDVQIHEGGSPAPEDLAALVAAVDALPVMPG